MHSKYKTGHKVKGTWMIIYPGAWHICTNACMCLQCGITSENYMHVMSQSIVYELREYKLLRSQFEICDVAKL
jgi:hypothetical protein